jgi:hypothetical protein
MDVNNFVKDFRWYVLFWKGQATASRLNNRPNMGQFNLGMSQAYQELADALESVKDNNPTDQARKLYQFIQSVTTEIPSTSGRYIKLKPLETDHFNGGYSMKLSTYLKDFWSHLDDLQREVIGRDTNTTELLPWIKGDLEFIPGPLKN